LAYNVVIVLLLQCHKIGVRREISKLHGLIFLINATDYCFLVCLDILLSLYFCDSAGAWEARRLHICSKHTIL